MKSTTNRRESVIALLVWVSAGLVVQAETPSFAEASKPFQYDSSAPLDLKEVSVEPREGAIAHEVSYASPKGGAVTAFIVIPEGKGPFAGIVYQHWGFGNRNEFLPETLLMAKAGAVCISVDGPWNRPGKDPVEAQITHFTHPEIDRDSYVQTVIDLRRAVDVVLSRPGVDPKRIGFVGHSFGATWGGS